MRKLGVNMKSVSTILLSVALLLSISGLELRFHTCSTSGNTDYIVTIPLLDQVYNPSDFNCQCAPAAAAEIPHCEKCTVETPISDEDDCCDSGSEFIQLELEYLAKTVHQVKAPYAVQLFAVATSLLFENYSNQILDNTIQKDDPPPLLDLVGKYFIISHNQLKIPTA